MLFVAVAVAAQAAAPDPVLARMAALYDQVCVQAFPIDAAVDAAMVKRGAVALTPDQVRVTLVKDPGRGWAVKDGDGTISVILELPPFHACSVRRMTADGFADLSAYRAVVDPYQRAHPVFAPVPPFETDKGDLHVHAIGEARPLPTGGAETFYVFDQHITDPAKRAAGQTAVNVRFVHQIVSPGAH